MKHDNNPEFANETVLKQNSYTRIQERMFIVSLQKKFGAPEFKRFKRNSRETPEKLRISYKLFHFLFSA